SGHREEIFHSPVGVAGIHAGAVGVEEERKAGLARRTVGRNERRYCVRGTAGDRRGTVLAAEDSGLRVGGQTGATDRRLRVTARAGVEVEARAQPVVGTAGDHLHLLEAAEAVREEFRDTL